jgi:site-specific DNA recombinase
VNRPPPDGHKVIVRDPERFEAMRKCWDLMLTGKRTPAEIRGIATTVLGLKTTHGPIGRTTLYNLFSKPFYHGSYEYPKASGNWHAGRHTPMVTKEEFDAVQRLLSRSKHMSQSRHVFAFTGLIRRSWNGKDQGVT